MRGGKRDGSGRPRGALNRRTAEAIAEVAEAYPGWSPLLHLATVANDDRLDVDIRLEAAKAAAPFVHARPKHMELDPDGVVELERRIQEVRSEAHFKKAEQHPLAGLAERLDRMDAMGTRPSQRVRIIVDSPITRAPGDPFIEGDAVRRSDHVDEEDDAAEELRAAMRGERPREPAAVAPPAPAPVPQPVQYQPMTIRPEPVPFAGPTMEADYSPFDTENKR